MDPLLTGLLLQRHESHGPSLKVGSTRFFSMVVILVRCQLSNLQSIFTPLELSPPIITSNALELSGEGTILYNMMMKGVLPLHSIQGFSHDVFGERRATNRVNSRVLSLHIMVFFSGCSTGKVRLENTFHLWDLTTDGKKRMLGLNETRTLCSLFPSSH
jgi:hypothetical protein